MIELSGLTMTEQFAEAIGHSAMPGDNLILTGDLGAGKTTLTKGIAQGLGITQMIKSPTYTIIREYSQGRIPLYHMDIYRVAASGADLGLDEYFDGDGVSVVEWAQFAEDELPDEFLAITFKRTDDENKRILTFDPRGQHFQQMVDQL